MKMIKYLLGLFLILFALSCEVVDETPDEDEDPDVTEPGYMDIAGVFEMNYGPHDLAVSGKNVFACRDDKIYVIDLSDVKNPKQIAVFDDLEAGNGFSALCINNNILYAGCTSTATIYSINISTPTSLTIISKFSEEIYSGKKLSPYDLFYNNGTLWASGGNGSNGMLVQLSENNGALTYQKYYALSGTGNGAEGVWANNSNVFISTADGKVHAFNTSDISAGPTDNYIFSNEPGHEHWGRGIVGNGNRIYWADWGAGFVALDITNTSDLKSAALITHSSFKAQHPDAEGTNVYDVLIHKTNGKIYLANGWSGLVEVDPADPAKVSNYVDYKDDNYNCIEQYSDYVLVGDIAAGTTDVAGIKIIKITK